METQRETPLSVSWKQIGIVSLSTSLGFISALLLANTQQNETTNFSTTELIGFTLSVVLSGASIVLAIAAIALGKSSEQAVIRRSDESIRLQNEVFTKTTEALQRIESSTGVTEKRIEDIISGRVGDISHQVAKIAAQDSKFGIGPSTKDLEESIRNSILSTIRPDRSIGGRFEYESKLNDEKKSEEEYQTYHDKLLLSIGNAKNVSIEKLGHGGPDKEGLEAFDAIFLKENVRFAVSTFRPNKNQNPALIPAFMSAFLKQLAEGKVNKVFVVFFSMTTESEYMKLAMDQLSLVKPELANNFKIISGTYGESEAILDQILSVIENRMTNKGDGGH